MGTSPVISGLVKKHVGLQSRLKELEAEADGLEDDIDAIAKAILVVDPDYPIEDLKPLRRKQRRIVHKRGDIHRILGNFLKTVEGQFTSIDARQYLAQTGEINIKNADTAYLTLRCSVILKSFAKLGLIKEIRTNGKAKSLVWVKL